MVEPRVMVSLEAEATETEIAAVKEAFAGSGIEAEVSASFLGLSADLVPWHLTVGLIVYPLGAFITAVAAAAGEDAWRSLKRLVSNLYEARRGKGKSDGVIHLEAPGIRVELDDDLPDEAYQALARGDLSDGLYAWDRERGEWRNYGPGADCPD
jgi:hypothetical protein